MGVVCDLRAMKFPDDVNWIIDNATNGMKASGYCVDIDPLYNRLIAFYSDKRNPHEVMPSHSLRFAVTTWYFDETAVKTMAV